MGRCLSIIERLCLGAGAAGLLVVTSVYFDGWFGARQALAAFEASQGAAAPADGGANAASAVAVLGISRLGLEVPVFVGTDRRTLNRGAGVVEGTALPGDSGNTVISAHRDSHFRPLRNVQVGDVVELHTGLHTQRFQVVETFITDPLDVSVLEPSDTRSLTLITCYPFQYVGFAPDRFIVRAKPIQNTVAVVAD